MIKHKLNQNELSLILQEEDVGKKKDIIQKIGIEKFKLAKGNLICTWTTSTGKTTFAIKLIKSIRKITNEFIDVVVPNSTLKDQWEKQLTDIENVQVFIINSYVKFNRVPLLLVVDEVHKGVANKDAVAFNKINKITSKYKLYLSATLKHSQLRYLESIGLKHEFNIDLNEGDLLGLFPPFEIVNLNIPLTIKEQIQYKECSEKENSCKIFLNQNYGRNFEKATIKEEDKGLYYTFIRSRSKRISIVNNAENKMKIMKEIIPLLTKKTILFSKTIKAATTLHKISKQSLYTSNQLAHVSEKHLELFMNNEHHIISSVNKLIEGFDDAATDCIIRYSFDSSALNSKQSVGRIIRYNPLNINKKALMVNLVCEPFEDIVPCDNYWLQIGFKNVDMRTITIQELKTLI